jgi:hypothetical protein
MHHRIHTSASGVVVNTAIFLDAIRYSIDPVLKVFMNQPLLSHFHFEIVCSPRQPHSWRLCFAGFMYVAYFLYNTVRYRTAVACASPLLFVWYYYIRVYFLNKNDWTSFMTDSFMTSSRYVHTQKHDGERILACPKPVLYAIRS